MEHYFSFIQHDIRSGVTIIFACMVLICVCDDWIGSKSIIILNSIQNICPNKILYVHLRCYPIFA